MRTGLIRAAFAGVVLAGSAFIFPLAAYAQLSTESGTIDVDLVVQGCNNNLICEPGIGETTGTCPLDCPAPVPDPDPVSDTGDSRAGSRRSTGGTTSVFASPRALSVHDVELTTTTASLRVSFRTDTQSIAALRIGRTALYEQAAVAEFGYRFGHELRIDTLLPGTQYYYELRVIDAAGASYVTQGTVSTNGAPPVLPNTSVLTFTPTVSALRASPEGRGVVLSWDLYDIGTAATVRVVRTVGTPAQQPAEGVTIYEGSGTEVFDTGVIDDATYVYTVFLLDASGATISRTYVSLLYVRARPPFSTDTFTSVFTDGALEAMTVSITQDDVSVPWKQKQLMLGEGKKVLFSLPKQSFFAPLTHHQLMVSFYDVEGNFLAEQFITLSFSVHTQTYEALVDLAPNARFATFRLTRSSSDEGAETVWFSGVIDAQTESTTTGYTVPNILLWVLWLLIAGLIARLLVRMLIFR